MLINGTEYQNPYIKLKSEQMAKLLLDAISYRMGFSATDPTIRLDDIKEFEGGFIFQHPAGHGFSEWEKVMEDITSYTVIEYVPETEET